MAILYEEESDYWHKKKLERKKKARKKERKAPKSSLPKQISQRGMVNFVAGVFLSSLSTEGGPNHLKVKRQIEATFHSLLKKGMRD